MDDAALEDPFYRAIKNYEHRLHYNILPQFVQSSNDNAVVQEYLNHPLVKQDKEKEIEDDNFTSVLANENRLKELLSTFSASHLDSLFFYGEQNLLHVAVAQENFEALEILLNHGMNVEVTTLETRRTILHLAVLTENESLVEYLLENTSVVVDEYDCDNYTAWNYAIASGDIDLVKLLHTHDAVASIHYKDPYYRDAFDYYDVRQYMCSCSFEGCDYYESLVMAASKGYLDIVTYLIETMNYSVNESCGDVTVIEAACRSDNRELVEYLVENYMNIIQQKTLTNTCVVFATLNNSTELVKYLLEHNFPFNFNPSAYNDSYDDELEEEEERNNDDPLIIAVSNNNVEMVQLFLDEGYESSNTEWTALHQAAYMGSVQMVELVFGEVEEVTREVFVLAATSGNTQVLAKLMELTRIASNGIPVFKDYYRTRTVENGNQPLSFSDKVKESVLCAAVIQDFVTMTMYILAQEYYDGEEEIQLAIITALQHESAHVIRNCFLLKYEKMVKEIEPEMEKQGLEIPSSMKKLIANFNLKISNINKFTNVTIVFGRDEIQRKRPRNEDVEQQGKKQKLQ